MSRSIDSIKNYINSVRLQISSIDLWTGILRLSGYFLATFLLFLIIESIFYIDTFYRHKTMRMFWLIYGSGYAYYILRFIIHKNQWFGNSDDETIARYISGESKDIEDRILNSLQLEKRNIIGSDDSSLIDAALNRMRDILNKIPASSIKRSISKRLINNVSMIAAFFILVFGVYFSSMTSATQRLLNPSTEFPIPLPFYLSSLSGNLDILGGDSIGVSIAGVSGIGQLPDSVSIKWEAQGILKEKKVAQNDEVYDYYFYNVNTDIIYWAEVQNTSWFSPWSEIATKKDTIFVTDRPVIKDIEFLINPPKYSKMEPFTHPGNITNINALIGSQIQITASVSKVLSKAWIEMDDGRENLINQDKKIMGSFILSKDTQVSFWCIDKNMVANNHPPQYRVYAIPDQAPEIIVYNPEKESNLDESMEIELIMQIMDDYGLSKVWLEYMIVHPNYLDQDTLSYMYPIENIVKERKIQQVVSNWPVGSLNLGPEDELHFQIYVQDNNDLTGPSTTKTSRFIARYPSLEDLFMDLENREQEVEMETENIQMTLEDVQELVKDLELELLKTDEMNWDQTQKVEESLQKMEDIQEQIQEIQEQMEVLEELAEKNEMISPELQDKFSKLQDLLSEMLTPEFLEAMEKLQEAMEKMDTEEMLQALQEFEFNAEEFEEQLDRFMEMFQQAMAEQKLDEIIKRMEEMVEKQAQIMEELSQKDPKLNNLASMERRQEEEFKNVREVMKDCSNSMEKFSETASEKLKNLEKSELASDTQEGLEETRKSMQEKDVETSNELGSESQKNLEEILSEVMDIQEQFQNETVSEMMNLFQRVSQSILSISQDQEQINQESKLLKSRSPMLVDMAVKQGELRSQTNQSIEQLIELSRKTFYISPNINRAMGKARTNMDKAIATLEQRQLSTGRASQKEAIIGLNEAANMMISAMDMMQASGSASGFESFLEALAEMSQAQQGINQGTMQLGMGGMGTMGQEGLMKRLQAQQQQLQQSLSELLGNNPGQNNTDGLGEAGKEMEEIIEDFKRKKIDRQTMERQDRVLSRMLDAQKSMTQRDYSEKRKSKQAEVFGYDGPGSISKGYGQKQLMLIEAMEEALQGDHTPQYMDIIKTYFRELQKEEDRSNE